MSMRWRGVRWFFGLPIPFAIVAALVTANISAGACTVATQLSISPVSGPPGTQVMVSGGGFAAGQPVDVSLGANGPILATVNASEFNVPVTIPQNASGIVVISATDHAGDIASVGQTFSVSSAQSAGPPGGGTSSGNPTGQPPNSVGTGSGSGTSGQPGVGSGNSGGATSGSGVPTSGDASGAPTGLTPATSGSVSAPSDALTYRASAPAFADASGATGSADGTGSEAAGSRAGGQAQSGAGTVYGRAGNGFRTTTGSALFPGSSSIRTQPNGPVGPGVMLLASVLPLLFLAGGVVTVRRRKATRRT